MGEPVKVFVAGCGYVGERIAKAEQRLGSKVSGVVRRPDRAATLKGRGLSVVAHDLDQPQSDFDLSVTRALVYYLIPPPQHGECDGRIRAWLNGLSDSALPLRVVLISTTGVYGDCQGDWVNESRHVHPKAPRARRRVDAEAAFANWRKKTGVTGVVLRVPGIYGPDRLPVKRLRSGAPVVAADEAPWSNRVHVDDLCRVCLAAARVESPHSVYNVSDGHPTTMTDFFFQAAASLGLPCPPVISMARAKATLGEGMLSYLAESKRIDNTRMRNHLRIEPEFPDLARGFADAVRRSTQA